MAAPQLWLINARSGNGAGRNLLRALSNRHDVVAVSLDFDTLAEQLTQSAHASRLVVAGGDGTFASVLCALSLPDIPVAVMPLGTANDLARELGISQRVKGISTNDLPDLFARLPVRDFATWNLRNGSRIVPFCNYASIGYEGKVVSDFSAWRSRTRLSGRWINRFMYSLFGTKNMLSRIHGLAVRADDAPMQHCGPMLGVLLTNIRSHLGLGFSNGVGSPFDSRLECISSSTALSYISMLGASLHVASAPTPLVSGERIEISGVPRGTALQIDGEPGGILEDPIVSVELRRFVKVAVAA